jgi:hypothetical protein
MNFRDAQFEAGLKKEGYDTTCLVSLSSTADGIQVAITTSRFISDEDLLKAAQLRWGNITDIDVNGLTSIVRNDHNYNVEIEVMLINNSQQS